jgi:hypothetical protein
MIHKKKVQSSESLRLRTLPIVRNSNKLENTKFWKLDLSQSSGEERDTSTTLGPLERANLSHWNPHMKTETDPFSETLYFLVC